VRLDDLDLFGRMGITGGVAQRGDKNRLFARDIAAACSHGDPKHTSEWSLRKEVTPPQMRWPSKMAAGRGRTLKEDIIPGAQLHGPRV
jgi:hypothetical protein